MGQERFEHREYRVLENEGEQLFAVAHFPVASSAEQRVPAVLCCHGFGGNKIGQNRLYVLLAEQLTRMGIAVLRVDFRGCGDSEGRFGEMTMDSWVSDAALALEHLQQDPRIDSTKIGILGCSLGGPVAILAAQKTQIPMSMALWAAVASGRRWRSDWENHYANESLESRLQAGGKIVSEAFQQEFLALEADVALATMPQLPLLHIHGNKDVTVFPTHAEDYRAVREQAHSSSQFLQLPNSDHHFNIEEERHLLISETATWFKKILI